MIYQLFDNKDFRMVCACFGKGMFRTRIIHSIKGMRFYVLLVSISHNGRIYKGSYDLDETIAAIIKTVIDS